MAKSEMACHEKGKTTNLTVNQVLENLFRLNEKPDRTSKYTDKDIADFIQSEFEHSVVNTPEVNRRRRQYNLGLEFWSKRGPATYAEENITGDRPFSYQYNAKGERQPINYPMYKRESTLGQGDRQPSINVDEIRESILEAVRASIQSEVSNVVGNEIGSLRSELQNSQLSDEDVMKVVQAELAKERPSIVINVPERNHTVKLEGKKVHKSFEKVMRKVKAGVPILLVGPAGSGKTFLAAQIAEALGLPFTFNSMSEGVSESSLLGRTLPDDKGNWNYVPSPFVTTYSTGGVHLLDEVDASDPNLMVQINAAIANKQLSIPFRGDPKPIKQHKDCILIAAANTFGNGADRQYVGRNQLDAATVNRFTMGTVEVDYDADLETSIVASYIKDEVNADRLLVWAWKVREAIRVNRLRRIMSTRNIEDCAKCLIAGDTMEQVEATYFSGWTADEKAKITSRI